MNTTTSHKHKRSLFPAVFNKQLIAAALMASSFITYANTPTFQQGEVLVAGTPDDHPELTVTRYYPLSNISLVSAQSGKEQALVAQLKKKGKNASLNFKANKFYDSNDTFSALQWHFNNINLNQAHTTTTGAGAVVAVLDTGFRTGGNDSVSCLTAGRDIVNNDATPSDGDGHGTHVAGTIAQTTGNHTGVAGVAPDSCIMAVKVLDDNGSGSFIDIAEGIHLAVANGADVINMSLGVSAQYNLRNDTVIDPALDNAYASGVTVIAAAGNDGYRNNVSYPAIYPSVIAVGATDFNNRKVRYSNSGDGLEIMAPGGDTRSDKNRDGYADGVLQETFDSNGEFGYWFFQGTSMASPHVAGVAALLIANGTATSPDDVRKALQDTALDLDEAGFDSATGFGLVQANTALTWTPVTEEPPTDPPTEEPPTTECTDADGDGYCAEEGPEQDCDDSDPRVHPGMNEKGPRKRDGIDNDCDGVIDP